MRKSYPLAPHIPVHLTTQPPPPHPPRGGRHTSFLKFRNSHPKWDYFYTARWLWDTHTFSLSFPSFIISNDIHARDYIQEVQYKQIRTGLDIKQAITVTNHRLVISVLLWMAQKLSKNCLPVYREIPQITFRRLWPGKNELIRLVDMHFD